MNLLLSNFSDENSKDLDEILISYQEYFNFKKIKDDTYLYLDINNLKDYINEGKDIKYRKFIFLYLENLTKKKKFKNYSLNNSKISNKLINYILSDKILDNYDIKNIKKIVSLIKYFNVNTIKLKNNNIFKLDDNFYADIKNKRFTNFNFIEDYKINFKSHGFIINNSSYLKNLIIILNSINNNNCIKKSNNKIKNSLINTNCNLVITNKIKYELFTNLLKSINPNVKYLEITNINNLYSLKYNEILDFEYIFLNMNILNNYFKKFENIYGYCNYKNNIDNSIIEELINNNFMEMKIKNIFLYNWKNMIIDNFNKMNKSDLNYLRYLNVNNYNFINIESNIDDYLLKNMSQFLIDSNDIDNFGFNNYKYFIKNELIIINKNTNDYSNDEIIDIENNEESDLICKLCDNEVDLAQIFFKSKNKYLYKDNETNIGNIIKDNKNSKLVNDIIKNKDFNKSFCCICMDRIDESKFCVLDCCHYFCKNCILTHKINEQLNNFENKCPVCRYNYNMIYNIIQDDNKFNIIMNKLDNILQKEFKLKNKVMLVAEHNEILSYLEDYLKDNYKTEYYKKKKSLNDSIKLASINYLKKSIIDNIDIFIFFTFSDKGYQKYIEIKNLYNDYYINKNQIKFYIFNYNKN